MSNSTLQDFYKGMSMPNFDGQNVLNQLKQLEGQTQQLTTETMTITKTVEGRQVPPIGRVGGDVPPTDDQKQTIQSNMHTSSFERHVEASRTQQAASKIFNMKDQSFGQV